MILVSLKGLQTALRRLEMLLTNPKFENRLGGMPPDPP